MNSRRRFLHGAAAAAAGLAGLAGRSGACAQAASGAAALSHAEMVQDIDAFATTILARDRSFSPRARDRATRRLAAMRQAVANLTPAAFELELARIAALADNGHTGAAAGSRSRRYNRIGVRLVPFGSEFRVLRAMRGHEDLLGAQILEIDGTPLSRLRTEARALSGGTAAWRDRFAPFLFESPDLLFAVRLTRGRDAATYRFRTLDGGTVNRRLIAEPPRPDRPASGSSRWLMPERLAQEGDGWAPALAADRAPWSIQAPGEPFRWREAAELRGLVVGLRQTSNSAGASIADFLVGMEAEIARRRPENLVVDLRLNSGGDLTTTRAFMQRIHRLVSGRVFLLTSPWTFSAAITSVAYARQAGGDRVVIVGEPVGDRLEFFAEGGPIPLPNSQAVFQFASYRHDYRTGCRGKPDCYRAVMDHPIAISSLKPDLPVAWKIRDYMNGRDTAMEAIAAHLARRRPRRDAA